MNKTDFLKHIKELNSRINLNPEAQTIVENTVEELFANEEYKNTVIDIFETFRTTYEIQMDRIEKFAEKTGIKKYRFWMAFVEILSLATKEFYKNRRIDENIFYDSMTDISIWVELYHRTTGEWALEEYDWVTNSLSLEVIRLGRLQFQLVTRGKDDKPFTIAGINLKSGSRLINIHIPEGDSITKEKRMDSYRKAYKFFNQTGHAVFMCGSWLIFGEHDKFLEPDSNILSFTNDFVLKETIELTSDLWRIFGKNWEKTTGGDYAKLPEDTKMQRAYKKWLLNGGPAGISIGYFVFDGENIIS